MAGFSFLHSKLCDIASNAVEFACYPSFNCLYRSKIMHIRVCWGQYQGRRRLCELLLRYLVFIYGDQTSGAGPS